MTAHVVVRCLDDRPATMSGTVIGLLRDELGFDGVVLSDALDMRAISAGVGRAAGGVAALGAGVDLLCIGNPVFPEQYDAEAVLDEVVDAVERAVIDGSVAASRLEEAAARVGGLADALGPAPAEVLDDAEHSGSAPASRGRRCRCGATCASTDPRWCWLPDQSCRTPPAAATRSWPGCCAAGRTGRSWRSPTATTPRPAPPEPPGARSSWWWRAGARRQSGKVVDAVLAAAPRAVVVHEDQGPEAARSVRSYGGGAATAHAVSELLGGGA